MTLGTSGLEHHSSVRGVFAGSPYGHSKNIPGRARTLETTETTYFLGYPGTGAVIHTVGVSGSRPLAPCGLVGAIFWLRDSRRAGVRLSEKLSEIIANTASKTAVRLSAFCPKTHPDPPLLTPKCVRRKPLQNLVLGEIGLGRSSAKTRS